MSSLKKFMNAAAGTAAAASGPVYVEDVFSTYLYTGDSGSQGIENGIALGDFGLGTSTEFDGTSDYLSKSYSAGAFGSGSKTFTFSAWVWWNGNASETIFQHPTFIINTNAPTGNILTVSGYSNTYATIFDGQTNAALNKNSWNHLLISIDLSNTSNRYIYINDTSASATYPTYTDTAIGFDVSGLATISSSSAPWTGKLAHVYLDYTYRDLSVVSNRRLFIDANGGSTAPSTLSALSPILYLPMTEDYTIGKNLGTGGDFTANGSPTIVQSGTKYQQGYGAGGLVWTKNRNLTNGNGYHRLSDTERGVNRLLTLPGTYAEQTNGIDAVTEFKSDGYVYNNGQGGTYNYVSWTFRKAPKFFDIVTFTSSGASSQQIAHNLGSVPGCIIVKDLDSSSNGWFIYHRAVDSSVPEQYGLEFTTAARNNNSGYWNNTQPTSTHFTIGNIYQNITNNYVAYLFAHNDGDGGFGENGDQDIIKCGSYTGTYPSTIDLNLGFEPQWILIKNASQSSNWGIFDVMRGLPLNTSTATLAADSSAPENGVLGAATLGDLKADGLLIDSGLTAVNVLGDTHIYIAIRRGPMRTPTSGSEVFNPKLVTATATTTSFSGVGFSPDLIINGVRSHANYGQNVVDRLRGVNKQLYTPYISVENTTNGTALVSLDMDGFTLGADTQGTGWNAYTGYTSVKWCYKRAPGFFDVVAYTGNGVAGRTVSHNLGVVPEMMLVKCRDNGTNWRVYHVGFDSTNPQYYYGTLDVSNAIAASDNAWNNTKPNEVLFALGNGSQVNNLSNDYIAYLFASLDGISKVGSYTGNGTSQNINCGFSAGARFVLIKRTDDTGDWYVWDTARGIVTGNDPFLALNSAAVENSSYDSVDPYSAGFSVNQDSGTNINVNSGTYIFLAIS